MIETKIEVRLMCDGGVVLEGHIDKLPGVKSGRVKSWQFPCHDLAQLDIAVYKKVVKKKPKK